jgi:tRNA 5-methylaminomethyl-2-thiouridine biosynthesis bifunctional protein
MPVEPARLSYCLNGTPFSEAYDDIYHAAAGAHAQANHVFLAGNKLPERWQGRNEFVILETGFGLGLNFFATWQAWLDDPLRSNQLHFISLEKHPFSVADLALVHASWPEFSVFSEELCQKWPPLERGEHRLEFAGGKLLLSLVFGDAIDELPQLAAGVDAFFMDGFSPAKNPEMWSSELCYFLAQKAVPGATLATWSVAGNLRRALISAGFVVAKQAGFGFKRKMLAACYQQLPQG